MPVSLPTEFHFTLLHLAVLCRSTGKGRVESISRSRGKFFPQLQKSSGGNYAATIDSHAHEDRRTEGQGTAGEDPHEFYQNYDPMRCRILTTGKEDWT